MEEFFSVQTSPVTETIPVGTSHHGNPTEQVYIQPVLARARHFARGIRYSGTSKACCTQPPLREFAGCHELCCKRCWVFQVLYEKHITTVLHTMYTTYVPDI